MKNISKFVIIITVTTICIYLYLVAANHTWDISKFMVTEDAASRTDGAATVWVAFVFICMMALF